nr:MAG: hypothetical protein [Chemarfal virus 181]
MNCLKETRTTQGTSPRVPRSRRNQATVQAVQRQAASKPFAPFLRPTSPTATPLTPPPGHDTPLNALSRPSVYTTVTTVSMLTSQWRTTSGPLLLLDSRSRRPLWSAGSEGSTSWLATIHQQSGKDVLIVCLMSRDRSPSSTRRCAYLKGLQLSQNSRRKLWHTAPPTPTHPFWVNCVSARSYFHLLGSNSTHWDSHHFGPSFQPARNIQMSMLTDGWTMSWSACSLSSTDKFLENGWLAPRAERTSLKLHFVQSPQEQSLKCQSSLTERSSIRTPPPTSRPNKKPKHPPSLTSDRPVQPLAQGPPNPVPLDPANHTRPPRPKHGLRSP